MKTKATVPIGEDIWNTLLSDKSKIKNKFIVFFLLH